MAGADAAAFVLWPPAGQLATTWPLPGFGPGLAGVFDRLPLFPPCFAPYLNIKPLFLANLIKIKQNDLLT